jgi:16S rRNA (uracil1498-N3)-methyltransferase
MTRRRFYAPPQLIDTQTSSVVLPDDEARHLRDALRLRTGDEAFVFDGAGREFRCVVQDSGKRGAALAIVEAVLPAQPESSLSLTLGVALLKGEKFDWVVQKATELGVTRLAPLQTARADARLRDARDAAQRVERWRRVALAAAKQSGRAVVPQIVECAAFSSFVSERQDAARFFFTERGGAAWPAGEAVSSVAALVGPEGGWSDEEITLAQKNGWHSVTLGGRILRAETAALVAVTLLQHSFGDLR